MNSLALSRFFTLSELSVTSKPFDNTPPPAAIERLRVLAVSVLDPLREAVGPIRVTSGYRSAAVNAAVGGSSTSQHRLGEAADIVAISVGRPVLWAEIVRRANVDLPVDQAIIYEGAPHVHVSTRFTPTVSRPNRGQLLVKVANPAAYGGLV